MTAETVEAPDWRYDVDAYPDWMHDVFPASRIALPHVLKWQQCIRMLDLTPTDQHVALVLSTYMHANTLRCWPSVRTLAANTGRKPTTVRAALRTLESRGWLTIERYRTSRGDERRSNKYEGSFPHDVHLTRGGGSDGKVVGLWQNPF